MPSTCWHSQSYMAGYQRKQPDRHPEQQLGRCFINVYFRSDCPVANSYGALTQTMKVMAYTSAQIALGTKAPSFALLDTVSDNLVSLADIASPKATVIMFICNHCPYVQHILDEVVKLATAYIAKGASFAAINSNDTAAYPQDGPQHMKALALEHEFPFPYLYDQTQQVARLYQAACTPEFFIYDSGLHLAYHGQFDDSRPKNETPVTGQDLRAALDALLSGQQVPQEQRPGIGCGIKWRVA